MDKHTVKQHDCISLPRWDMKDYKHQQMEKHMLKMLYKDHD